MTTPITGPFTRAQTFKGPATSFGYKPIHLSRNQRWFRQRKPYNLPLEYSLDSRQVLSWRLSSPSSYVDTNEAPTYVDGYCSDSAYAKAYERFKNKILENAELGVSLAERKQAMGMVAARGLQLASFAKSLSRFRFGDAARALDLTVESIVHKKGTIQMRARRGSVYKEMQFKKGAKHYANNYLEFHFGWSPLIGDIGRAVEILQGGIPPIFVKSSATVARRFTQTDGSLGSSIWTPVVSWSLRAQIQVSNPNLLLANQLGFVNPALILWELVPFSFVLDWFVNVSDFLSSFTDFAGVELLNASRTRKCVTQRATTRSNGTAEYITQSVFVNRYLGQPPGPKLRIRDPWSLSPRRGLAAISLLTQRMKTSSALPQVPWYRTRSRPFPPHRWYG